MARPGTTSGAVEHRFGGKGRILVNRDHTELLRQEAVIRRDFGEEGVRRFWEEVNKRAVADQKEGENDVLLDNASR